MSHASFISKGLNQAFKSPKYGIWVVSLSKHLTATVFFLTFFTVLRGRNMIYCWHWSKYMKTCGHTLPSSSPLTQWLSHYPIQKPISHNLSVFFLRGNQIRSHTQPFYKNYQSKEKKISKTKSRRHKGSDGICLKTPKAPQKTHKDEQRADLTLM